MNNLRYLRERRGLTLRDVEEKTSITFTVLARMERDEQQISEQYARILADFYKVSLDTLFNREFKQPNEFIYKESDITYDFFLSRLSTYSNKELAGLIGAAEFILKDREDISKTYLGTSKDKSWV